MRIHFVLNHGDSPASKLADVEIHFEEGLLTGLKLVGCSVWRSKKGEAPTVLVPSRSYPTLMRAFGAAGVRYYEDDDVSKSAVKRFKEYIREEYQKIAGLPEEVK